MKMIRTIGAFLFAANALSANTEISSVSELNNAFEGVTSHKIGFLSRGNYEAIQGVLPRELKNGGKLEVELFTDLQHLEDAVVSGDVIAGLATSPPADAKGKFNVFGAGLVTPRAAFFKPGKDGDAMKEAFDAALVRVIASGDYQAIKAKYYKSNGFTTVAALTCSTSEDSFPFPDLSALNGNDILKAVINSGVLRVGSLGGAGGTPADWGYQGNYTKSPPSGFWPEFEAAIFQKIIDQYPLPAGATLTVERVWNASSAGVMDSVLEGRAEMTAPYWTVPAFHKGASRHYQLAVGCTTIGTEQQFFTLATMLSTSVPVAETSLPPGAIAGIAISIVVAVMAIMLICIMINKEKKGQPLFTPLLVEPKYEEP